MENNRTLTVDKIINGNKNVLFQLFDECYDRLYGAAQVVLKSPDLADSVIVDSMMELWNYRHSLDRTVLLEAHIARILERRIIHTLKSMNSNKELKEEVWKHIKSAQEAERNPISEEHEIKSIQNNLQQLILHKLTSSPG